MIMAASGNGWIDGDRAMMESLLAFKRAGADGVLSYFAVDAARLLAANRGGRETEVESCPTLAQIGAAFPAGHGPGSLLWYLQDASRWLQGEPGRTHATGWLLEHAGDLLTAEDVGALEALLVDPHFASNDGTSSARQKFCHGSVAGIDVWA